MKFPSLLIVTTFSIGIALIVTLAEAQAKSFTIYQPSDLHVAAKGAVRDMANPMISVHVAVNPGYYSRNSLIMSQIKKAWPFSTHMTVERLNTSELKVKFLINGNASDLHRHFKLVEAGRGH